MFWMWFRILKKNIPGLVKPKVKYLFINEVDAINYRIAYEEHFAQNQFQTNATRTRLGNREIVGLPLLKQGTIFATIDGNIARLIDEVDSPANISDIQIQDRYMKVLAEFSLGYDFGVNQLVYLHTADGSKKKGLNNDDQNKLSYPNEKL